MANNRNKNRAKSNSTTAKNTNTPIKKELKISKETKNNKSKEDDKTTNKTSSKNSNISKTGTAAGAATVAGDNKNTKSRKSVAKDTNTTKKAKNEKKKDSDKKPSKFVLVIKNLVILFIFFLVLGLLAAYIVINFLKSNTIEITENNFWQSQSTALVYNSDKKQIGKLSERDVKWTELCRDAKEDEEVTSENTMELCGENQVSKVSPYYINALIATEDQHYLDHNGVDFKGLTRATLSMVANGGDTSGGGASSITMQLAKLLYLGNVGMYDADDNRLSWTRYEQQVNSYNISYENSIQYKLSQMAIAMKIEDQYSKNEIMENYVNTMWFGRGGYGISNAAKYYYGVNANNLTISQAATLAGMTQLPDEWDPYENPEETTKRRNTVINRMESVGYITSEEAEEARNVDISSDLVDHSNDSKIQSDLFKYYNDVNLYVLEELQELLGENADHNTGGMKIYTTVDAQLQKHTIDVLDTSNGMIGYTPLDGTQTGTAMIDVSTGGILAIGNGFDGESPYAYAYNELRNPGSTAKPLTAYAPAIEYLGWSTAHNFNDKTTYYTGTNIEVNNYSRSHRGNVTMMTALATSLNTTAVQSFQAVVNEVGIEAMSSWFRLVGLEYWQVGREESNPQVYESYALGAFGSTPVEMASAFATFANDGVYNEPHIIEYIVFDESSPYYEVYGSKWYPEYETHKAMDPSTAYLITKMLNPSVAGSITTEANVYNLDMAIKTGTSNWGPNNFGIPSSAARDRWTVGYSPDVATAVWYGYEYSQERQGKYFYTLPRQPLALFRVLMAETVDTDDETLSDGSFTMPDNVVTKYVGGVLHYFISGSDELKEVNTAPVAPTINISLEEDNVVNITWNEVERAETYNILVDGEVVANTDETSAKLTYQQLFGTGCKSSYQIGVQTVGTNGLTSGVSSYQVSNNVDNCNPKEEEEDDKDLDESDVKKKSEE